MDVAAVRAPSVAPTSEPTSPVFQTCTARPTRAQCPRNAGQRRFGAATSSSRGTADNPGDWVRQSNFRSADSKTPERATASSPSTLGIETAHHPQRRNLPESAFDSGGRRGAEVAATTSQIREGGLGCCHARPASCPETSSVSISVWNSSVFPSFRSPFPPFSFDSSLRDSGSCPLGS